MVALTEGQRRFLNSQRIPESAVFDASGMARRRYQREMERQERFFAIDVTECFRGHQSIRTRAGHCIQCGTANIAFILRYYREAYVYIAGSLRERVVKIGCSKTPWNREEILNTLGYGNISDWQLLYYAKYSDAGKVEFAVHRHLSEFAAPRTYIREYNAVDCREIFSCGYSEASQALTSASPDAATNDASIRAHLIYTSFWNISLWLNRSVRQNRSERSKLLRTPNFGRKSLNEIKEVLAHMGLHLGMVVKQDA